MNEFLLLFIIRSLSTEYLQCARHCAKHQYAWLINRTDAIPALGELKSLLIGTRIKQISIQTIITVTEGKYPMLPKGAFRENSYEEMTCKPRTKIRVNEIKAREKNTF